LLVIRIPLSTNRPTTGWNSKDVPVATVPRGTLSKIQPLETQYDINAAMEREVGIGVPSKYLLFPVASLGTLATVILNRARRVRPQRTKKVRNRWSTGVRRPMAKAAAAGDTPNEIYGWYISTSVYKKGQEERAYQIRQGIKLLPHQTALLPPSRDLPVHEIEEQPKRHESQRRPEICMCRWRAETISH
jgi:hypothetical protein